jgi:ribosomal subunit interface protein
MQLTVTGKQIDVGDALRTHIETRLKDTTGKYFADPMEAHVTLSREGGMFRADLTVHVGRGMLLQSNASAAEPYPAFDQALDRLSRRLRRYKNKIRDNSLDGARQKEDILMASAFVLHAEDDEREEQANDNPVVVAEMTTPVEILTVSEAVMRLDLGDLPALMFRNRAHGGLNMIYRRPDGHIGWIDPQESAAALQRAHVRA